jgi:gamma-D-glutamyl-L-lysine dipeptidyl-peptidase
MKKVIFPLLTLLLMSCGHGPSKVIQEPLKPVSFKGIDSICQKWVPVESESLCTAKLFYTAEKKAVIKGQTNIPEAKKDLLDYLNKKGISYIDSLTILPDASVGETEMGIVTVSVCNIRRDPAHASELITQALMGTPVKVLKNNNDWYLVQTPDSYIGWVDNDAVSLKNKKEFETWKKSERVICTVKTGDITDERGGVVSDFVSGAILQVTGQDISGYNVLLPDGRQGLIQKNYVDDFSNWALQTGTNAEKLISFGRTLLGTQYLWGGISSKGIDCSGFARACYFSCGIIIPRDASSQALYGKEIDIADFASFKPGDLLFFGHIRNGKKVITHVGIYIGNGEVMHSSGMVKINSLNPSKANYSKRLRSILQTARRFMGEPEGKGIIRVREHNWYF